MSTSALVRLSPQHTLVLPIARHTWPPPMQPVRLDGLVFAPKRELHVTLIGSALGRALRAAADASSRDAAIAAAFAAQDWRFTRTGRLLRMQKPIDGADPTQPAGSIIETIDLPAMAPFHAALSRLLAHPLPVPPAHVTLYTQGTSNGIGVPSDAALLAMTVRAVAAWELSGV